MSTQAERYKALRQELETLNTSIATIQGQRQSHKEQLENILKKHGVKTVEELKKKLEDAQKKAEEVEKAAQDFILLAAPRVKHIQEAIAGTLEGPASDL